MKIFKYTLRVADQQTVPMPRGARILCAQNQNDRLTLWALVDDRQTMESRQFLVIGTGEGFNARELQYIGSVQIAVFVWHIFEVTP